MPFDKRENLKSAILKRKARIASIDAILSRPASSGHGWGYKPSATGRQNLAEERERLLMSVRDLEQQIARMATVRQSTRPATKPAVRPVAPLQDEADEKSVSIRVARKLADPEGSPSMTVREAMQALSISKATTYRWLNEGRLKRVSLNKPGETRKAVRISTASVKHALEKTED